MNYVPLDPLWLSGLAESVVGNFITNNYLIVDSMAVTR